MPCGLKISIKSMFFANRCVKKKRKEKNDKIFWNALIKFNKIKRLEIFLRRAFTPIMHSLGYIFKSFI